LETIEALDLVEQVAPIQLAIRLLITNNSLLLELPDIQAVVAEFDPASLTWPWHHPDSRVDALQQQVMRRVGNNPRASRPETFAAIRGLSEGTAASAAANGASAPPRAVPMLSENWYCCAEPSPEDMRLV
jgi:hypothetical protein